MKALTIGQLAKRTGVGVEAIRFYEREGLVAEPERRRSSGYRQYPPEAMSRLRFIRHAKELGFRLKEIKGAPRAARRPAVDSCGRQKTRPGQDRGHRGAYRRPRAHEGRARATSSEVPGTGARGGVPEMEELDREHDRVLTVLDMRRSSMNKKRKIQIFSPGCPVCLETIDLVNRVACSACDVAVLDMTDADVAERARQLGIRSVPAVVIHGRLADCCAGRGPDEVVLRNAGLGQPT